jgi:predicted unusual protein kinase regulating ubiquinone biosynthesis (AarF/ABC1/UbiB family)
MKRVQVINCHIIIIFFLIFFTFPAQVFASAKSFEKPVAAASLGQVYKAKLLDGQEVAVKVQRPNMKLSITLDLYIVRKVLEFLKLIPRISEECQAFILVLDNWGSRFIDELDYGKEVENCERFRNEMTASSTTLGRNDNADDIIVLS